MYKIILNDGSSYEIFGIASLGSIHVALEDFKALESLAGGLLKPKNLSKVCFETDGIITGTFYDMTQDTTFSAVNVCGGKIVAEISLREMTSDELQQEKVMTAITYLSDDQALTVKGLYPDWEEIIGQTVCIGTRFNYGGNLYKTIRDNLLIQAQWIPGEGTESLYVRLDESHAGTLQDPIPWVNDMQPKSGKYYIEGDLIAECIEDPGQPLYNSLAALCPGRYFRVVE